MNLEDFYIARNGDAAARALGGNMVIMSAESSLFTLNEVGTAIWLAADGVTPLSKIVNDVICNRFDIDPITARADAEEFVSKLARHGVLVISSEPIQRVEPSEKP